MNNVRVSLGTGVGSIIKILLLFWWLCGFVVAKGFWATLFCLFPPYSFYLVIERLNEIHKFLG